MRRWPRARIEELQKSHPQVAAPPTEIKQDAGVEAHGNEGGWLGIKIQSVTEILAEDYGRELKGRAFVSTVNHTKHGRPELLCRPDPTRGPPMMATSRISSIRVPGEVLTKLAIDQTRLQDWIANRIKAKKALILLDTCESGALTRGFNRSRVNGPAVDAGIG